MNTRLKRLFGKSALAAMAVSFATALSVYADTGSGGSCSDSGGSVSCTSGSPCCISGTDHGGNSYSIHSCCTGSRQCKIKYTNGSIGFGGIINASLTVDSAGCL
jgi:hypothetical protein